MAIKVSGIKQVQSNLQKRLKKIAGSVTERSMTAGVLQLASYASELTPVDTSNLINSQYTFVNPSAGGWKGGVGYTADYAVYVHDDGPKNWQKSGAEDQFLEKAAERNESQIFNTIVKEYRRQ